MARRRRWSEIGDGWDDVPAGWDTVMFSTEGPLQASDHLASMTAEDRRMIYLHAKWLKDRLEGNPWKRKDGARFRRYVTADGYRFAVDDDDVEQYEGDIDDIDFLRNSRVEYAS